MRQIRFAFCSFCSCLTLVLLATADPAAATELDDWRGHWTRAGDPSCSIVLSPGRGNALALSMSCGVTAKGFAQWRDGNLILVWRVPGSNEAGRIDCHPQNQDLACAAMSADGTPRWTDRMRRAVAETAPRESSVRHPVYGYGLTLPAGWQETPALQGTVQSFQTPDGKHSLNVIRSPLQKQLNDYELREILRSISKDTVIFREEQRIVSLNLQDRPAVDAEYVGNANGTPVRTMLRLAQTEGALLIVNAVTPVDATEPEAMAARLALQSFIPGGAGPEVAAATSDDQPVTSPARGTSQRSDILNALRPSIEHDVGEPVQFVIGAINVMSEWAYVDATPQRANGQPIDWRATKFRQAFEADMFSGVVLALLRQKAGQWETVAYVVGPTDVAWIEWAKTYNLPEKLFTAR